LPTGREKIVSNAVSKEKKTSTKQGSNIDWIERDHPRCINEVLHNAFKIQEILIILPNPVQDSAQTWKDLLGGDTSC
jgi:hypothetical protein